MTKSLRTPGHDALIAELISARKAMGLTQTDLAALLNCHQSFVARIESGQRRIDVVEFILLGRLLKLDLGTALERIASQVPKDARI